MAAKPKDQNPSGNNPPQLPAQVSTEIQIGVADNWPPHDAAVWWPRPSPEDEAALFIDLDAKGQIDPGVVCKKTKTLIDGLTRQKWSKERGVPFKTVEYLGDDPWGFVDSKNTARRHLTTSQKAMLEALRPGRLAHGGDRKSRVHHGPNMALDRASRARRAGVSEALLGLADFVKEHGAAELITAVKDGAISVAAAAELAKKPVREQRETLTAGPQAVKKAAATERQKRQERRQPPARPRTSQGSTQAQSTAPTSTQIPPQSTAPSAFTTPAQQSNGVDHSATPLAGTADLNRQPDEKVGEPGTVKEAVVVEGQKALDEPPGLTALAEEPDETATVLPPDVVLLVWDGGNESETPRIVMGFSDVVKVRQLLSDLRVPWDETQFGDQLGSLKQAAVVTKWQKFVEDQLTWLEEIKAQLADVKKQIKAELEKSRSGK